MVSNYKFTQIIDIVHDRSGIGTKRYSLRIW
jgi:hypothetical protein